MREILFRAKRKDNGEWVYGDLIHEQYGIVIQYYQEEVKEKGSCAKTGIEKRIRATVYFDTVCQYTGLTDKSEKKIFEGDIVRNKDKWSENTGVIVFKNGRFMVDWRIKNRYSDKGNSCRTDDIFPGDEIIGNIYDNPEMVESKVTP